MRGVFARHSMPSGACWLGYSGAIPFVLLAFLVVGEWDMGFSDPSFALRGYGAVILSFLGGIQWGLLIQNERPHSSIFKDKNVGLGLSVIPSLIGWMGLLIEPMWGVCTLVFGFVIILFIDLRTVSVGLAPKWYLALRIPLTGIVVVSLIFVLVAGIK